MNSTRLLFVILISFLLNSTYLFSQEEDHDAVYLQLVKEFTLNPDGSMDYHYTKELKLQTYRAFTSLYGETFIIYHPAFQTLKINQAFTIMADGKKVSSRPMRSMKSCHLFVQMLRTIMPCVKWW